MCTVCTLALSVCFTSWFGDTKCLWKVSESDVSVSDESEERSPGTVDPGTVDLELWILEPWILELWILELGNEVLMPNDPQSC